VATPAPYLLRTAHHETQQCRVRRRRSRCRPLRHPLVRGRRGPPGAAAGAHVNFTEYEAESARTNGSLIGPSYAFTTIAAEATGRRAVRLAAGQWLDFTLLKAANAVDIRYSIADGPDAALHLSAGGHALPDVTLTAAYSHYYGNYPFTNNATEGGEHHYFDDVRTLLGRTLAAGTTVRLKATAATVIDLADLEKVAAPAVSPAGYLDATAYGADPTGAADSGAAIQAAIDAAAAAHTGVWLPSGTYTVTRQLVVDQVSVRGAGPGTACCTAPVSASSASRPARAARPAYTWPTSPSSARRPYATTRPRTAASAGRWAAARPSTTCGSRT